MSYSGIVWHRQDPSCAISKLLRFWTAEEIIIFGLWKSSSLSTTKLADYTSKNCELLLSPCNKSSSTLLLDSIVYSVTANCLTGHTVSTDKSYQVPGLTAPGLLAILLGLCEPALAPLRGVIRISTGTLNLAQRMKISQYEYTMKPELIST